MADGPPLAPQNPEQIGGVLQSIASNGSIANQLLGQLIEVLSNTGTIAASGEITSSGATSGIGYTTGAGGTVTQLTNKSTGVTINKVAGQITMNNAALNAGIEVSFTVTNSAVEATDIIMVQHTSGGTAGSYGVFVNSLAAGSFAITVTNLSAGNLSEAVVLSFAIIRGATA